MHQQIPILVLLPEPERKARRGNPDVLLACGCDVVFAICLLSAFSDTGSSATFSLPVFTLSVYSDFV